MALMKEECVDCGTDGDLLFVNKATGKHLCQGCWIKREDAKRRKK